MFGKSFFVLPVLILTALLLPLDTVSADNGKLTGKILLEVEKNGEAWYMDPVSDAPVFLGTPDKAWQEMNMRSVAISTELLDAIKAGRPVPKMLAGLFVQNGGSLLYIEPNNRIPVSLSDAEGAYRLLRNYGLGVKAVLSASMDNASGGTLDLTAYEDFDTWWGRINSDYAPVMASNTMTSWRMGWFSAVNRVKILEETHGEAIDGNDIWYKIDGGAYPGAYVHSSKVDFITQPLPPSSLDMPAEIRPDERWIDVNLSRNVLTLYRYDQPLFSTYTSPGTRYFPTWTGIYRVQTKLTSTRMSGGPPRFPAPYDLANVPHTMYYSGSFAIHGTYWHDKFGTPQSHGCINLTQGDAEYIFSQSSSVSYPRVVLADTTAANPGTLVYNHY